MTCLLSTVQYVYFGLQPLIFCHFLHLEKDSDNFMGQRCRLSTSSFHAKYSHRQSGDCLMLRPCYDDILSHMSRADKSGCWNLLNTLKSKLRVLHRSAPRTHSHASGSSRDNTLVQCLFLKSIAQCRLATPPHHQGSSLSDAVFSTTTMLHDARYAHELSGSVQG